MGDQSRPCCGDVTFVDALTDAEATMVDSCVPPSYFISDGSLCLTFEPATADYSCGWSDDCLSAFSCAS